MEPKDRGLEEVGVFGEVNSIYGWLECKVLRQVQPSTIICNDNPKTTWLTCINASSFLINKYVFLPSLKSRDISCTFTLWKSWYTLSWLLHKLRIQSTMLSTCNMSKYKDGQEFFPCKKTFGHIFCPDAFSRRPRSCDFSRQPGELEMERRF